MNIKKVILCALLALSSLGAQAQFSQMEKKSEFMLKVEAGYLPFMGNFGEAGDYGYYLNMFHSAANLNFMLGANLSQDWFIGGGAGFNYYHNFNQKEAVTHMGANIFFDADFRPIWQGLMGLDYQPATIRWAPMFDLKLGVSTLFGDDEPAGYGLTLTPMLEGNVGINYYYHHGLRDMKHNWHAFYVTIGVAYMQQTLFLPIRVGWRW